MSVIISTEDKTILYSIIAKNTDKFLRVEEKFYDAFPEFGKVENSFWQSLQYRSGSFPMIQQPPR